MDDVTSLAGNQSPNKNIAALVGAGLDHAQISFQASEADDGDRISGFTGGHEKKIAVSRLLRQAGLPLTTNMVVHRQNLHVDQTNEAYVTGFAIDMIRSRNPDRPFFQVCSYNGPHPPFMIPEPYFSLNDPAEVPLPRNFGQQPGEHPAHADSYYRDLFNDHGGDFDPDGAYRRGNVLGDPSRRTHDVAKDPVASDGGDVDQPDGDREGSGPGR